MHFDIGARWVIGDDETIALGQPGLEALEHIPYTCTAVVEMSQMAPSTW